MPQNDKIQGLQILLDETFLTIPGGKTIKHHIFEGFKQMGIEDHSLSISQLSIPTSIQWKSKHSIIYQLVRFSGKQIVNMYGAGILPTALKKLYCIDKVSFCIVIENLKDAVKKARKKGLKSNLASVSYLSEIDLKSYLMHEVWKLKESQQNDGKSFFVNYTASEKQSAEFVCYLTKSISLKFSSDSRVPMNIAPVKSKTILRRKAKTLHEGWFCFLLEIPNITKKQAEAILKTYPTCESLMTLYSEEASGDKGLLLRENVKENGKAVIGESISNAVYQQLCANLTPIFL